MADLALDGERRQERPFGDLHVVGGDIDIVERGDDLGMNPQRDRNALFLGLRQKLVDAVARAEILRLVADHLLVDRDGAVQVRHRAVIVGLAGGKP